MRVLFFLTIFLSLICSPVFAAGEIFQPILDAKAELEEKGLTFEAAYIGEYWVNTQGGTSRHDTYMDNIDVTLTVDTQKAGLWENGQFFAYFLSNGGGRRLTGSIVGDLQTVSGIDYPRTSRLMELWYEHFFREGQLSVLGGIHDYNSEAVVSEHGGLFVNSSFGQDAASATGSRLGAAPLAAPGVRIKYAPRENVEWLVGIYDGDPDDPENVEHFPRFDFDAKGGLFIGSEVAYHHDTELLPPGTVKLGFWGNTGDFDHVVKTDSNGNTIVRQGSFGGYTIFDQWIYQENEEEGLAGFLQLGGAPRQVSTIDFYFGAGFRYVGLIPNRNKDEFGIAVAMASISNDLVDQSGRDEEETVLEVTYKAHICDNFSIQPDVQYVFNPNGDPAIKDAIVTGLRFELSL